jgi:hypothetical protein
MRMIEAIRAFEAGTHRGTQSPEYASAIASFGNVDVETLEDVSSMIAIAIEVVRAGHGETGLMIIRRAMQVPDKPTAFSTAATLRSGGYARNRHLPEGP